MDGINRVILLGSLGAAPELRYTQSGTPVLNMRLATNGRYQNKDKEWVEATEWHSCVCFGARAEALAKILDKGSSMAIEGSLRTSSYEKDGVKRYKTEIVASHIALVGKGRGGEGGEEPRGNNNGEDDGGSAPQRGSGQRTQQAPRQQPNVGGGGNDDFEVTIGRDKGKMLSQVDDPSWLRGVLTKDLADPSKSKFHAKCRTQIAAIDAELARRGGGGASKPARSSGGSGYAARGGRQASRAEPEEDFGGGGGDGGNGDSFDTGGYDTDSDIPFGSRCFAHDPLVAGIVPRWFRV